jgi:L-ribulose-5-phosphate 4-epimerase
MHTIVYRLRPSVGAVIHTHSPAVTAFALAHRPLDVTYEALLHYGAADAIPVADWGPRGSDASLEAIERALDSAPTAPAVLLANHGLLAFAESPTRVARLIVALEEAAELSLAAESLGGAKPFPPGALQHKLEHTRRYAHAV